MTHTWGWSFSGCLTILKWERKTDLIHSGHYLIWHIWSFAWYFYCWGWYFSGCSNNPRFATTACDLDSLWLRCYLTEDYEKSSLRAWSSRFKARSCRHVVLKARNLAAHVLKITSISLRCLKKFKQLSTNTRTLAAVEMTTLFT